MRGYEIARGDDDVALQAIHQLYYMSQFIHSHERAGMNIADERDRLPVKLLRQIRYGERAVRDLDVITVHNASRAACEREAAYADNAGVEKSTARQAQRSRSLVDRRG